MTALGVGRRFRLLANKSILHSARQWLRRRHRTRQLHRDSPGRPIRPPMAATRQHHHSGLRQTGADVQLPEKHHENTRRVFKVLVQDDAVEPTATALANVTGVRFDVSEPGFSVAVIALPTWRMAKFSCSSTTTIVLPGWLDAMLAVFQSSRRPVTGAQLYRTGGCRKPGASSGDGSAWNFGRTRSRQAGIAICARSTIAPARVSRSRHR